MSEIGYACLSPWCWLPRCSSRYETNFQDQLKGVQHIQASHGSFLQLFCLTDPLLLGDFGGNGRAVQGQLKGVQHIQASYSAFAAILTDGSVVPWGQTDFGVLSRAVQDQLKGVQQIQASARAFAAILSDGSVITWGHTDFCGDSRAVQDQWKGVQRIQASHGAFAAVLSDGSVVICSYVSSSAGWKPVTAPSMHAWIYCTIPSCANASEQHNDIHGRPKCPCAFLKRGSSWGSYSRSKRAVDGALSGFQPALDE